jgi:hypothetical protein
MIDDDALDRALSALPLEEPPERLHARILAATVYRPRPIMLGWEMWLIVTLVVVVGWLSWMVLSAPHLAQHFTEYVNGLVDAGLTSPTTLAWVGVGISAAWCLSQLTIPGRRSESQ